MINDVDINPNHEVVAPTHSFISVIRVLYLVPFHIEDYDTVKMSETYNCDVFSFIAKPFYF